MARIRCLHGTMQQRPCGRCSGQALREVRELGEDLVRAVARALMHYEGYTGEPTPLTYVAAVDVARELRPWLTGSGPDVVAGRQ